ELLPPLGGTDEVAELDRTFHSAAVLIEGAKRMRQEVTAMISHDLKSPLQSIRSYLEMLETGILGELNEKGERLLVNSQRASDHMSNLIDSVLQLEKLRSGSIRLKQEKVVLSSLLTTCLDLVRASADGKAVRLETSFEHDDSDCVIGDEFWLKEVFVNILSNAVKFTPEKSKVTVSTRQVGDRMEVAVADEGPGIRDSEKKVIFERFSRLKSAAAVAGTGLGLPIAKELVEMHHGSIEVDSHVGLGSTFVILLPVSKPSTDA
ncbi:MAG TPA: HAMP domain-containing sensor histidine kinase, partial [Chroococcales cyanobacterium]